VLIGGQEHLVTLRSMPTQRWQMQALDPLTPVHASARNGAIMASANHGRSNGGPITPFPITTPAQRRSATFLRYLVGYRVKDHRMPEQTAMGRARFRDCVRSVIKAAMPGAQNVAVVYTERFYDPIWQGLWAYHTHRLAEVVRTIAAREAAPIGISASITMVGSRHQMAAHVAFRCRGEAARHDVYSLPIRPLETPRIVAGRFAAELRTLGVKLAADAPRRGTRRNGGRLMVSPCRAHRQFTQFGLRLPL
jgi:hypothetical protein